jgi:hypothetical protein
MKSVTYAEDPSIDLDFAFRTASCTATSRGAVAPSAQAQNAAHGLSLWEFSNKMQAEYIIHGGREIL